jgi:hypothetical protein
MTRVEAEKVSAAGDGGVEGNFKFEISDFKCKAKAKEPAGCRRYIKIGG